MCVCVIVMLSSASTRAVGSFSPCHNKACAFSRPQDTLGKLHGFDYVSFCLSAEGAWVAGRHRSTERGRHVPSNLSNVPSHILSCCPLLGA